MAKKQGVNYGPNASLIQGAATAYRNYDNMPGMYAGLDKVTEAGMGVVDEAVKGYEAEQEKLEKKAKEAQAKADQLNDNWNSIAAPVFELAGSFMKDVEYKDTVASVKALRQEYLNAQNSKDAEKMAEVKIKFNNINTEISAHKDFRALLTNPEYGMSDFVKGDNLEYMNGFINEDYVIGRNDKKEKTYTVNGVTKTMKEINEMVGVKDNVPYGKYGKLVNDYSKSKNKGNRDNLEAAIRNGIVPDNTNALRAFLNDDGFGNGQTFSDLLNEKGNRASIEKEIMNTFDDGDGIISETEYENFVNAIVSPDNEFWKNNGGASAWKKQSKTIATELLANGAENAWTNNPDNKPGPIITNPDADTPLFNPNQYFPLGQGDGSVTGGAINGMVNKIKVGRSFPFEGNNYDHVDGGWYLNYNDGTKEGEEKSTPESDNYIGDAQALIFNAFGEGGNDSRFNDITTKKLKIIDAASGKEVQDSGDKDEKTSMKKGLVSKYSTPSLRVDMNFMSSDDNYIGSNLNKLLPSAFEKGNEDGYKFEVDKLDGSIFALLGDDPFREAVALKDDEGNVLKYPDGHEYEGNNVVIKTGGNLEERKQAIATLNDILETFGFNEYINTSGSEEEKANALIKQYLPKE
tara:strand:+ start:801 stop:2696 length:1896 start_codon:yes stop_codon:yes gene_type:complete